ncbi:arylsulfatase A-like [Gouania willdenowi]|uniref:Arylsulfatase A-like n=1 Tax=Gouania willdenowi TaxID=441366 RepID=A0A8C5DVI4_GOUWI|nr:arylsulfatase A-like [Gouania willdenowi]
MDLLLLLGALVLGTVSAAPPNFVLVFADDLGFGDLGCYGHPSSLTPNLDRMAAGGLRFTDFYCTSASCSPSRASLLTGRYQTRTGVYPGVFFPSSIGGLPLNETTIAEVLKTRGYSTAAMGKWHLGFGTNGTFLPVRQGFDHFLGIPYSHDQGPCDNMTCFYPDGKCFGTCDQDTVVVPLMKDDIITEQPISFIDLEKSYSDFGVNFIKSSVKKQQPFFLYYPAHHTHYPQYAGRGAAGRSLRGPFGDSLLELDDTIGRLIETLRENGVLNNTLVFFTADNGPQLSLMSRGGNSGPLKCGKGTTYEGGMRMPSIAYWPGTIRPGVTHELASTLDLLPTFARLAGAKLPDVFLDGVDMTELLTNRGKSKREVMMFYPIHPNKIHGLFAIRLGKYKAHYYTEGNGRSGSTPDHNCSISLQFHHPPLLFDLEADVSENYPLNVTERPDLQDVLEQIKKVKLQFEASMVFGESQIEKGKDPNLEPCCRPQCSPKPQCCHC